MTMPDEETQNAGTPVSSAPAKLTSHHTAAYAGAAIIVVALIAVALFISYPHHTQPALTSTVSATTTILQNSSVAGGTNPNKISLLPTPQNITENCPSGDTMNYYLGQCQASFNLSSSVVSNVVSQYLSANGYGSCPIAGTQPSYYGSYAAEAVVANCGHTNSSIPNQVAFILNSSGGIENVSATT